MARSSPFAEAFSDCCRTSLGIFKTLLAKEPELISQANKALVEHVRKNNRKWVDLMLWLGADPRAETPGEFEDESTTALVIPLSAKDFDHQKRCARTLNGERIQTGQ